MSNLCMCTVLQTARLFLVRWVSSRGEICLEVASGWQKWQILPAQPVGFAEAKSLLQCGLFKITSPSPFVLYFSSFLAWEQACRKAEKQRVCLSFTKGLRKTCSPVSRKSSLLPDFETCSTFFLQDAVLDAESFVVIVCLLWVLFLYFEKQIIPHSLFGFSFCCLTGRINLLDASLLISCFLSPVQSSSPVRTD